jgi:hypothetical protein
MKRRQTIRPLIKSSSRSRVWALQLMQRYGRYGEARHMQMLLCVPVAARSLVLLQQRMTSFVRLAPQVNVSLDQRNVVNSWTNFNSSQMTLLKVLSLADESKRARTDESFSRANLRTLQVLEVLRSSRHVREVEHRQHVTQTLATKRSSTDLSNLVSQRFSVQREAQFREVSTQLTQRLKRINELAVEPVPKALRTPANNRMVTAEVVAEVLKQRDVFQNPVASKHGPQVMQPPLNVELLAEQVMKQIDRRVIARRERMGQV